MELACAAFREHFMNDLDTEVQESWGGGSYHKAQESL